MKSKEHYEQEIKRLNDKRELLKLKSKHDALKNEVEPSWFQKLIMLIDRK